MVMAIARPCRSIEDRTPKGERRREGDDEQSPDFQHVGKRIRALERMRGIGVEEAAAIGAEFLDRLLAGDRAYGQRLLGALERRRLDRTLKRLRHAESDQGERDDDRHRQEHVKRRTGEVDPEIADCRRFGARETAHQRKRHRKAGGGGYEIVHREAEHLRQVAHRRLAAVVLPIGVGDEAHRRVEGEVGGNPAKALRIERQIGLEPLQGVERRKSDHAEGQHRHRVGKPVLLPRRINAGESVEDALNGRERGREQAALAR